MCVVTGTTRMCYRVARTAVRVVASSARHSSSTTRPRRRQRRTGFCPTPTTATRNPKTTAPLTSQRVVARRSSKACASNCTPDSTWTVSITWLLSEKASTPQQIVAFSVWRAKLVHCHIFLKFVCRFTPKFGTRSLKLTSFFKEAMTSRHEDLLPSSVLQFVV